VHALSSGIEAAARWSETAAAGVAGLVLVVGIVTLLRRQVVVPRLRPTASWRPWGWSQVLFGVFVLTETLPRLAGVGAVWVLVCSLLAVAPLVGFVVLQRRARSPQTRR
jgi:hypothetical protein